MCKDCQRSSRWHRSRRSESSASTADMFKVLVKDLWALRLQSVQSKISYESETDTETPSSHLFTSQSESDSDAASRPSKGGRQKDAIPGEAIPTLIETLSFAYIGMLLLRVPVTVADVHKWANDGELLYYRASREVPLGMRERLPGRYQELLEPQDLLQAEALHRCILERLAIWQKDHGMAVPRLNTPLVLYRWMRDLALPIETFAATQRLMRTLSIELDFWKPTKVGANVVLRYPEVQLMAVLVVSTKLLFPYDDLERYPRSATDLSALALDWDGWVKLHKDDDGCRNGQRQLTFESAFDFSESDCLEAANDQLDTYLDWCEGNIANEDVRERGRAGRDADFRRTLFKMFPLDPKQPKHKPNLQSATEAEVDNRDGRTRNMLRPKQVRDAIEEERGVERAGSSYRRWRTPNDLVEPMKTLYEIAAKLAGSSIDSMVQAVFLTERKVQRHEERLRKDVRSKQ